MQKKTSLLAVLGIAGMICSGTVANAQIAQIAASFKPGFSVSTLGIVFNSNSSIVSAGTFNATLSGAPANYPTSFEAYCVDLAHTLPGGQYDVNLYDTSMLSNGARAAWLYDHYGTSDFGTKVMDADHAAALQVALWDVVYDAGNGFGSGNFRLQNLSGSVYTYANSYLAASSGKSDTASYFQSVTHPYGQNQDLIGPKVPPGQAVPEPGTMAFMGSSMAGLGTMIWRRRRK